MYFFAGRLFEKWKSKWPSALNMCFQKLWKMRFYLTKHFKWCVYVLYPNNLYKALTLSLVFSTNVVCVKTQQKVSNIMIKPNNSIITISLKIWYNHVFLSVPNQQRQNGLKSGMVKMGVRWLYAPELALFRKWDSEFVQQVDGTLISKVLIKSRS